MLSVVPVVEATLKVKDGPVVDVDSADENARVLNPEEAVEVAGEVGVTLPTLAVVEDAVFGEDRRPDVTLSWVVRLVEPYGSDVENDDTGGM